MKLNIFFIILLIIFAFVVIKGSSFNPSSLDDIGYVLSNNLTFFEDRVVNVSGVVEIVKFESGEHNKNWVLLKNNKYKIFVKKEIVLQAFELGESYTVAGNLRFDVGEYPFEPYLEADELIIKNSNLN
ncbi:hypothetical protein HN587_01830 [Candidatus Woesearchaeota archaeon]|jgi:hypothetical protein|nr:hypothetical protein [Candidatus Woesearchaeota archaeon]